MADTSDIPRPDDKVAAPPVVPATPVKIEPKSAPRPPEIGGPAGPEPTRYGDWERNGRCIDF